MGNTVFWKILVWIFIKEILFVSLGKSGGGKTTLLNIIGTLENYDSGSVTCFSNRDPIKDPKVGELLRREKIAYLFQNFALVEKMTVEENMMLAAKYNQEKK